MQPCLGIKIKNVKELEAITVKNEKGFYTFYQFCRFRQFFTFFSQAVSADVSQKYAGQI